MDNVSAVRQWFLDYVRTGDGKQYLLDNEQAAAVIDDHKNTLVAARAGAGKTHTLVAKIIYQIAKLGHQPSQIMAFVFNKKAANEISERLRKITVDGKPIIDDELIIARTFHSFAHSIVSNHDGRASFGKILMDNELGADTDESRSLYIQAIIEDLQKQDDAIFKIIYKFFRRESTTIDRKIYENARNYYYRIRNHQSRTLDGKSVRSFSEKIIADFFFEHGVKYRYEPEYYPKMLADKGYSKKSFLSSLRKQDSVKADFYLPKEKIVWEHWAITGEETKFEIERINQAQIIGDYEDYKARKLWKRGFYSLGWRNNKPEQVGGKDTVWYGSKFHKLIESYRPIEQSREDFEKELRKLCLANGIKLQEIPKYVLISRAWKKQVKYFTSQVASFIDRIQQNYYDDIDGLHKKIKQETKDNEEEVRVKAFHLLGLRFYKEYVRRLTNRDHDGLGYVNRENQPQSFVGYGTDFNMLLQRSGQILRDEEFRSQLKNNRDIKLILVDEYQDFSRAFFENLTGLREIFPDSKLFCVGDNWQAINRFAGSDDTYFSDFAKHYQEDVNQLLISNNYRSSPEIVENANLVMKKLLNVDSNEFAKPFNQDRGRAIIKAIDLNQYEIKTKPEECDKNSNLMKYVENIGELIIKHRHDKRILILHRKNTMLFHITVWGALRHRVRDYVTGTLKAMTKKQFDELVRFENDIADVMSVHKSKGLEADTVILLEVDPKVFPSHNSSSELFYIFGESIDTQRQDESRLYYVALTRAKRNLYVLWGTYEHRPDDVPEFIKVLNFAGMN